MRFSVDTSRMDVITFVTPENNARRERFPVSAPSNRGIARAHRASAPSADPDAIGLFARVAGAAPEIGAALSAARSFPAAFLLAACVFVASAPLIQRGIGHERLDRMAIPADDSSELAMRELVTPEPDASLLAEAQADGVPDFIQTVSYSNYKVRRGDTISTILARTGLRNMSTILSVNRIDNARRIRSGQSLSIPSMDGIVYTVARGDSLARVSNRYKIPVNAICDANDLERETLTAGQRLFIPGASLSANELRRAMGELFMYPIRGRLTSRFGYRSDPFTGVRTFHTGIDLAAPTGTPVKATLEGRVATTGYSTVFGNYIIITHDAGYQSLYGHLSKIGVDRGQRVAQGAVIGRVGNTGYSTGSHLHLSLYKNGKMINPFSVLN